MGRYTNRTIARKVRNDRRQDSYYLPLNQQIRIPSNIANIISQYNSLNGVV